MSMVSNVELEARVIAKGKELARVSEDLETFRRDLHTARVANDRAAIRIINLTADNVALTEQLRAREILLQEAERECRALALLIPDRQAAPVGAEG